MRQLCLQVHQIFAEKAAVKRAFQATVPTRMMTNQQFWAKYLKHQVLAQVRNLVAAVSCTELSHGPAPRPLPPLTLPSYSEIPGIQRWCILPYVELGIDCSDRSVHFVFAGHSVTF